MWKCLFSDITRWPFSKSAFPQALSKSSGFSQVFFTKLVALSCFALHLFFFFPRLRLWREAETEHVLCICICIHLLCFWPVNCNQILSLHEATETTLLRFSSRAPPCDLPPPSPFHLQRASWPHELMSKWHLEIMNVADHREDAENGQK